MYSSHCRLEGSAGSRVVTSQAFRIQCIGVWVKVNQRSGREVEKEEAQWNGAEGFIKDEHCRRIPPPLVEQAADDSRVNMNSAFEMSTTDIPWSRPAVGDPTLFTKRHSLPF